MPLSLTTSSRPAFDSLTEGLRAMDRYYEQHRVRDIERASACIALALEYDAEYGLAIYYKGVVLDLIGKPADAPELFDRILRDCADPDLAVETRFNLGVVNYHRYSHRFLERAKDYFDQVIAQAQDDKLKNMARAHLAQTHAMWMRPSIEQLPDKRLPASAELRQHIQSHFMQCQSLVEWLARLRPKEPRLVATYENAKGMSHMYYTDHVGHELSERARYLGLAGNALVSAEQNLPDDWGNTCDLGSLNLRLAVLARDCSKQETVVSEHLLAAKDRLTRVINTLRPGYGFALYELGIVHRVWRKWNEARAYLESALAVAERYRDINDAEVQSEITRVDARDSSYP